MAPPIDSDHSLSSAQESGNQNSETDIEAANPTTEIGNGSTILVAKGEIEEQREAERMRLDKIGKFLFITSVQIIIAAIDGMNKTGKMRGELILYKASAIFAILSFFADVGLLISLREENKVGRSTKLGLFVVAIVSVLAAIVVFAMNAII